MSRTPENFVDGIRTCCPKDILTFVEKHPPRRRAPHIRDFFLLAHGLDPEWHRKPVVITNACRQFLSNRRNATSGKSGKPVKEVTVISDYSAVHLYLNKLQKAKKLPSNTLLPPIPDSTDVFSEKECNILGYLTLRHAIEAPSMDAALNDIADQIEKHRSAILTRCKRIVTEGYEKFKQTQEMILSSDLNAMRLTDDNLDPAHKAFRSGQRISFFSKSHPRGFINTVAYLAEEQNGLYTRRSFPGAHHVNSWSAYEVRQHLGITDEFAVAAMCIIIDELGINVSDLANAKVKKTKEGQFVTIREDGGVTITTLKPRANKLIERHAPKAGKDSDESLDANTVLCMLLEMRERHALALKSNYLFVLDGSSKARAGEEEVYRILDTRRKLAFKAIVESMPEWVAKAEPTMPKIRVSRGLLKWIESGGDTLETTIYLGNSLLTALRNYIPPSIQEFVYRKRVRDHQNIQLLIADELTAPTSNNKSDNYECAKNQLIEAVKHLKNINQKPATSNSGRMLYFLCSPEGIELIVSYATYGTNQELISTCKKIITKIEDEGSRKMIKLLADTAPKLMNFDLLEVNVNE
ncbi:hypothetical protein ACEPT0_08275 [Pseudomonas paraeruginosa]